MILRIQELSQEKLNSQQAASLKNEKTFFLHAVVDDLLRYNPTLIFVERSGLDWSRLNIKIDYINFFAFDPRFLHFWHNYSYLETIGNYIVYKK